MDEEEEGGTGRGEAEVGADEGVPVERRTEEVVAEHLGMESD